MNIFIQKLREHVQSGVRGMVDLTADEMHELTGLYLTTLTYVQGREILNKMDNEKVYLDYLAIMLCGYTTENMVVSRGLSTPLSFYGPEDFGLTVMDDVTEYCFEDIEGYLEEICLEERGREEWDENRINLHLDNKERAKDMNEEKGINFKIKGND